MHRYTLIEMFYWTNLAIFADFSLTSAKQGMIQRRHHKELFLLYIKRIKVLFSDCCMYLLSDITQVQDFIFSRTMNPQVEKMNYAKK